MINPSWSDFGTYDESAYPDLWNGCVVAWFPGLGPSGAKLYDLSRFANNGNLTGASELLAWSLRDGRYSLLTDGLNDRVIAPNSQSLAIAKDLTISFWLYPLNSGTNVELIQKMGAGEVRLNSSWECYRNASRAIYFRLNGTNNDLVSTSLSANNQWTHVVCRKIGATLSMFFNATAVGTLGGQPDINISTGSLTLGAYPDGSFPINAHFDDVLIYNRGLSESEIRLVYQLGRGGILQRRARKRAYFKQAGFQSAWARQRTQLIGGGL